MVLELLNGNENPRWLSGRHTRFLIGSEIELDLYLIMIHQHTKNHYNISNGSRVIERKRKSKIAAWRPYLILDRLQNRAGLISYNDTSTYQKSF